MTQDTNKEDEQWLNAVAGRSDPNADAKLIQQAESLRRVLKARSSLLVNQVPEADDVQYQRLLFRLRREGLNTSSQGWRNPMLWGIAATTFLCVGIVFQMGGFNFNGEDKDILMGGGHETVLIVTDPEARLIELQAGLQAIGVIPKVERLANGPIILTVKATDEVMAYFLTQRLPPDISGGYFVLKLTPTKPKK